MIYSAKLSAKLISHIRTNRARKNSRFPFVLMLEPLFRCNLKCRGCGRIKEYGNMLQATLSREQCLDAAAQANAPIVSVTGGEPLLHPDIKGIVEGLLGKGYFVYLCSNGLLMEDFLDSIEPHPALSLVIHIDGMRETHSRMVGREDTFDAAVAAIRKAKKMGFGVRTNTTVYSGSDTDDILGLFSLLKNIGTDGIMVSPAFSYGEVKEDIFLQRRQANRIFSKIYAGLDGIRLYNTPIYWEFLCGKRDLSCVPWSTPTVNPKGWKSPCYLITDNHFNSYGKLMENTPWQKYGRGNDARCDNCMMHCGYEASSVAGKKSFSDLVKLAKWNLTGRL
ncbi:MAG: adenosyl-hopene transferase HpnH [Actinomycetota bacterium]